MPGLLSPSYIRTLDLGFRLAHPVNDDDAKANTHRMTIFTTQAYGTVAGKPNADYARIIHCKAPRTG